MSLFRKRWPDLSFAENFLSEHWKLGPITLFGENAMHWAFQIRCRGGYLCCRLPLRCFGHWWPLYCYWSRNGTPASADRWFWGRRAMGYEDASDPALAAGGVPEANRQDGKESDA